VVLTFVLGVAALGLADDALSGPSRGWRGHGAGGDERLVLDRRAEGRRHAGAGPVGHRPARTRSSSSCWPPGVLVLATNLFNLLDLRPGRSVKAFVLLGVALMIGERDLTTFEQLGLFIGPLLVVGFFDVRELAMLGDTGSNLIGALAGLWLVLALGTTGAGRRPDRAGADHRVRRIPLNFRPCGPNPRPLSPRLNRKDPDLNVRALHKVHLRHRGRRVLTGQGHRRLVVRATARVPRAQRGPAEVRPVHQRRPGDDVALPARRGLRDEDGAETDLDLGHYERFTSTNTTRASNVTAGGIYNAVIKRERRGDYLGGTVQVVPHITDEIKHRIRLIAETNDVDVVITEIGGTVGDIESLPFLEAIRQFPVDVGRRNCMYIHLTLVPYIGHAGELKTKPTQHSVNELRRIGIQPDMLLCRSESALSDDIRKKIAMFASLPPEYVVSAKDVDNIYKVPLWYAHEGVDDLIVDHFAMQADPPDLREWESICEKADAAAQPVKVALVGKYVALEDAYLSVVEALRHSGFMHGAKIEIDWVDSETLESDEQAFERLGKADGILVPGGFGGPRHRGQDPCRRASRASARSRTSACAWACRSRSASSRATSPACRAPTRPSSTSRPSGP
jgi:hypothetical protein